MREASHTGTGFSSSTPPRPGNSTEKVTLCVDCGGGGIKSALIGEDDRPLTPSLRTAVSYPFAPQDLLRIIRSHLAEHLALGSCRPHRITIGIPGIVRRGRIVYTPHYIREHGPHTKINSRLRGEWTNLHLAQLLESHFELPCLALNDAEVAACATVHGNGSELVLTLGTGLGCTFFTDGVLVPHLEISHAPFLPGMTYDEALGEKARTQIGSEIWAGRVYAAVRSLWPVFRWDYLYLGGGNTALLGRDTLRKLADFSARETGRENAFATIENSAGTNGGARAWALLPKPDTSAG